MQSSNPADREPARTNSEAKKRLLGVLNRSLSAVCSEAIWRVAPRTDNTEFYVAFTTPEVVTLRTRSDDTLYLRSTIQYTYVDHPDYRNERKASTSLYAHIVSSDTSLKPQLYSWEWNSAEPKYPHLHVRRGDPDYKGLHKLHIPTGRVFFESVLFFLIEDHAVMPCREDWEDVLGDSLRRVSKYSTWGGGIVPQ